MLFSKNVNKLKDDIVKSTVELIRFPSYHQEEKPGLPFGKPINDALEYVLGIAERLGFKTKNMDGYCGYAEYGEGDVYIGVFGHIDVSIGSRDSWIYPPFEGGIYDNRIYGAGASDKASLIACLYAVKAIIDSGNVLNRKVRIFIGTDNCDLFADIDYYLKNEPAPLAGFTIDGYFPVTNGEVSLCISNYETEVEQSGSVFAEYIKGGTLPHTVPYRCEAKLRISEEFNYSMLNAAVESSESRGVKVIITRQDDGAIVIETVGKETHSAKIELGINAVSAMLEILSNIDFGGNPLKEKLDFLSEGYGRDCYGTNFGISYKDSFSGALTVNLGAVNFENNILSISSDGRFPITCNYRKAIETIDDIMENNGFKKTMRRMWPPLYYHQDHFLIKALIESFYEVTNKQLEPFCSRSISYAVVMPNIVAFGSSYNDNDIPWEKKNENIGIDELMIIANIYCTAIYKLSNDV